MNNKIILAVAGLLILFGLNSFDFSNFLPHNNPINIDVLELAAPTDENILKEAKDVLEIVKKQVDKEDAKRLRDLYLDIKQLIKLDGDDEVVKNTEEIRQANSLAGSMLKLDIKGKYPNLAKECKEVIVVAIGDDQVSLSKELRAKGMDAFGGLAWAFNEGSK
jgi:hypothetical protein